jgi:type I restriction enzyme S subunit
VISKKIEEFAEVITGGTPSTAKNEYWDGGAIPWLNSGELNQGIVTNTSNYITDKGLKSSSAEMMPRGTILIALTGATTGLSALLDIEACGNQSVTGILPSREHEPKYLLYYLRSIRNKIISDSWGGAQKHISQGYVKNIKVPLPTITEQKKILNFLDAADSLRQKRKEQIKLLDDYLKSLFYEMFGDPVSNQNNYETTTVGEIASLIKDGPHVSPKYSDKGIPILSTRNIRPGELVMADMKYVSEETYLELTRRFRPRKGDVLLTKGGTTGYAKVVDYDWPFCVWVHLAVLRPIKSIDPIYLEGAMNSDYCYLQSQQYTHGIANRDLGLTRIAKIKLLKPPIKNQLKYADINKKSRDLKHIMQTSLTEMDNHFNALMQRCFG